MAKKISKSWKRFLSILFHLAVLVVMVIIYDLGMKLFKNDSAGNQKVEKSSLDKKQTETKDGDAAPVSGTSMNDLMAQKLAKDKAKKKEAEEQEVKEVKEVKEVGSEP